MLLLLLSQIKQLIARQKQKPCKTNQKLTKNYKEVSKKA